MTACPGCEAELAEGVLNCPRCLRLVHAAALEDLSKRAHAAWRVGKFAEERLLWEEALGLLPPETAQYEKIHARVEEINAQTAAAGKPEGFAWSKASAGIGPALLLILTKGKALLLGLTNLTTVVTMAAAFGVYWTMYGWAFAGGLALSIYVHEMGHVIAIRRYGFPASAPMFIPGLGAFIRLHGVKPPPVPDSRIGLAGPIYGLGAALVSLAFYYFTGAKIWAAIAHFGVLVNLFNLIPVWSLDGSRGFHSLTRVQRGVVLSVAAALWMLSSNPMLFLVAAGCGYRMFTRDWQTEQDRAGLAMFVGLLAALAAVGALAPIK